MPLHSHFQKILNDQLPQYLDVTVLLEYNGQQYTLTDRTKAILGSFEEDQRHIKYMWTEGNYGCDCNRSQFIREQCELEFPDLSCGNTIVMRELRIEQLKAQ